MTEAFAVYLANLLAEFHFLRPLWLALPPAAALLYLALRDRHSAARIWRGLIAPHLLTHLTLNRARGWRLEPRATLCLALALAGLALAGPAWQREPPPFVEDKAPLVIALDLGRTMNAVDVQPTRLTRAKQKIRDLLALRQGARTGLIVYAGSAHIVLPLTDDGKILASYVDVLSSEIMPQAGKSTAIAFKLARTLLEQDKVPGSLLFLTDGVEAEAQAGISVAQAATSGDADKIAPKVLIWGIGREGGGVIRATTKGVATDANGTRQIAGYDPASLQQFARAIDADFIPLTLDGDDVAEVHRHIESHLAEAEAAASQIRWRDAGYWLLWPITLLAALSFRRGWTVRW